VLNIYNKIVSQAVIKQIEGVKCVLWNTQTAYQTKINLEKYNTEKAHFWGTLIKYPPNKDRNYYMAVFVDFKENLIKKLIEKESTPINNYEDYKKIYEKILSDYNMDSEPLKFYKNFMKRRKFKEGLLNGRY